jgi:hypothetical protein
VIVPTITLRQAYSIFMHMFVYYSNIASVSISYIPL